MKVAVVGAGWAGLACAVDLADKQIPLTLFEAGRIPGGRARSLALDNYRLDNGQHLLLGAYTSTLELMKRVGADPEQLCLRTPLEITDAQGFKLKLPRLPYPLNMAWGLLSARGASLRHKLATLLAMHRLQRQGFSLPATLSVREWLETSQPDNPFSRHLWEPLCLAAMNTPAERASAQVFAKVLRDSLGNSSPGATDLLFPRAPLGKLFPEPALAYLNHHGCGLHFSHRVRSLRRLDKAWEVDGETFSHVVLATAPQHLSPLLKGVPEVTASTYDYEPIATLYLGYETPIELPSPLFNLGGTGQWVVNHGALERAPLLACVLSGNGPWKSLSDAELLEIVLGEIAACQRGLPIPALRWHKLIREQRATFSCSPGLARQTSTTPLQGLYFAGDHVWQDYPATLEGACRSGLAVAQAIIQEARGVH